MQLTLMLYEPHSAARRLLSATTPAFAEQYATFALAMWADIDAMLMILPRPPFIMASASAWLQISTPVSSRLWMKSHSSSGIVSAVVFLPLKLPDRPPVHALLTAMSRQPDSATAATTML